MNVADIQTQVNEISAMMVAKGLKQPEVQFELISNAEPRIYLCWKKVGNSRYSYSDTEYEFIRGKPAEALAKAKAFVAAMPEPKQRLLSEFMGALGNVIELGRQNDIDVEFLNPLVATMKTLSENVITDQRAA